MEVQNTWNQSGIQRKQKTDLYWFDPNLLPESLADRLRCRERWDTWRWRDLFNNTVPVKFTENGKIAYNKKLSYCWETVRRESMPMIAEIDVEMTT